MLGVISVKDPVRWRPLSDVVDGYSSTFPHLKGLRNGDTATSAIKQVGDLSGDYVSLFICNILSWCHLL